MTLTAPTPPRAATERWFRILFWIFTGSIVFSLAGTALLRFVPSVMGVFAPVYAYLVRVPTWTYMTFLPLLPFLLYLPRIGWARSLLFFAWGSLIGLTMELAGTNTGIPFGPYGYTDWLGPKILDDVPYFIPPSWYAMSLLSYDLAGRLGLGRAQRIAVTAVYMVLWDVALDPAMSTAFPFWYYADDGMLYNMPASNWVGWLVTAAVIAWGYEVLAGAPPRGPIRWVGWVWLLNGLFPLGLSLLYGMGAAVLFGLFALPIPFLALRARAASS